MTRYAQHVTGHAAEQFVCYDLARRGLRVASTPFEGAPYDILADYRGNLIRVQVKGTQSPRAKVTSKHRHVDTYYFNLNQEQLKFAELIALVALDVERVIYRTPEQMQNHNTAVWVPITRMRAGSDESLVTLLSEYELGGCPKAAKQTCAQVNTLHGCTQPSHLPSCDSASSL